MLNSQLTFHLLLKLGYLVTVALQVLNYALRMELGSLDLKCEIASHSSFNFCSFPS